ncbi:MAG: sigma-70 family RNA polymerase sigma factor [Candidatus Latescibacterota bacterium]|jgi:RNA polymerase sigma-70 factor (ECF subfamily)
MTDAELVSRVLAGDPASYGFLVDRYRGTVQGMAYHWTRDFDVAQDTVQEAFVQAYLHLGQLRDPERFGPWLHQLVANQCRRRARQERARPFRDGEEAQIPSPQPSPADDLERAERRQLVATGLRRLSQTSRLVICLHYLGDLPYPQVASLLGISANAVAARLHRARQQLKESLMQAIADGLRDERLGDEFTREVLEQARHRARQTQSRWARDEFVLSVDTGLEAARKLQDGAAQVEMLTMLGEASATWMSDPAAALRAYEQALVLARAASDRGAEARLLRGLYQAHLRCGEWGELRHRAEEAQALCSELGDPVGQALAQAALDLAENLPEVWSPDQPGGYALADFPLVIEPTGHRWGDLSAERQYSWGCPSRCAALIFLYRPRRLLGPSLELGARWEDLVTHQADGMSWNTDPAYPAPIARSEVISVGQTVVTPGGALLGCIAVTTTIAPPGGGRAPEHSLRSICGTRQAWFAPGVGLVRLRHHDQNGTRWLVWLVSHDGPRSQTLFPLEVGHQWRYRWTQSGPDGSVFEDLCRVVACVDGATHLSSATWGWEQSPEQTMTCLEEERARNCATADLAGEAFVLETMLERCTAVEGERNDETRRTGWHRAALIVYEELLQRVRAAADLPGQVQALESIALHDPDPGRARACDLELLRLAHQQGDELRALEVEHRLEGRQRQLTPDEERQWLERRLELAGRLGQPTQRMELLSALTEHYLAVGQGDDIIRCQEEHAQVAQELGDPGAAAQSLARAELYRAIGLVPEGPRCAYLLGTANLRDQDGTVAFVSSGCWPHSAYYPMRDGAAPTHLLWLAPLSGSELLAGSVGATRTDWHTYGVGIGVRSLAESLRATSTLVSKEDEVTVAAGQFARCALIETVVCVSTEPRPMDPEQLAQARGYLAGTKHAWFAPGIGLVRLRYAHHSGQITEVELTHLQMAGGDGGYLGLALGNRWGYRWTDAATGTVFEDRLRVAAHRTGQWHLAFVTRARMPQPG